MMGNAFRLGISEFTTMPWSFDQDVERYAHLGIDAIEIVEAKLDDERYVEQLQSVRAAGLTISGVQPKVRTFFSSRMTPEPRGIDERCKALRHSIEKLGLHAQGVPFITNTGAHPRGDINEAMTVVGDRLGELAKVAADNGVVLAIEPLNPTSVNVESVIWTIDQALEIIERADSGAVGLCLDYWNIWQNADVFAQIARAGSRIFTVQASDWRRPRSFADRIVPGDGDIPLAELIRATRATGYDLPYVVEIFSNDVPDSLYDTDLEQVVIACQKGFAEAWAQA
jgi:sugar phosphate isomerase/epimerase